MQAGSRADSHNLYESFLKKTGLQIMARCVLKCEVRAQIQRKKESELVAKLGLGTLAPRYPTTLARCFTGGALSRAPNADALQSARPLDAMPSGEPSA